MHVWTSLRRLVRRSFADPLQNRIAIIQPAIAVFSITKTVLSLHGGIDFGENDGDDDDYAAFLPLMEQLCDDLEIPPVALPDYRELLELWQRGVKSHGAISFADTERAQGLSTRYGNWVYDFFPGFQRTLVPGQALLTLGSYEGDAGDSRDSPDGGPGNVGRAASLPMNSGSTVPAEQPRLPPDGEVVEPYRRKRKPRSIDVVVTGAAMWVVSVGFAWIAPGLPPNFQRIAVIVAVYTLIVGALAFFEFRWSPEMVLLFYAAAAGWTAYFMAVNGIRVLSIATFAFELYGIWMYRVLRRDIRG